MNSVAATNRDNQTTKNPKRPQQRQTAKEIIAANVKSLIEQLEAGHSDALTAYLNAMSRFHNYSFLCYAQHRKLYVNSRTMFIRYALESRRVRIYSGCALWRLT